MVRIIMQAGLAAFGCLIASFAPADDAPIAPPIENPTGRFLVWRDYRIEINQFGDLGRNWPTPDLVWEQYALLKAQAQANPQPPNTLRAVLLVLPRIDATAVKEEDGREVVVGQQSAEMTSAEVKWALDQWRQFEEMVYVYSGGNAWLRTDIKIIAAPVAVRTDENWGFWPGQQRELLDRYIPFERGEYQSYNAIYCSKNLGADPHGGTIGAVGGIKGCGTSDNAWYGDDWKPNRTGYVALHEWMNQQCSATSNMMPYPDEEALWNNYVLHKIGYREDVELDDWPWLSARRDTMTQIIRPGMWRRWSALDPYESTAIGAWVMFGPSEAGRAREISVLPDADGLRIEMQMGKYTHFNPALARPDSDAGADEAAREIGEGTYYFRCYVASEQRQEVRLWAGADERFRLWLNGEMIRDGWGWNYSDDDGLLIEKACYPVLEHGFNTLLLELPNTDAKVEFRVRFCDVDGSGRQPPGVSTFATRDERPATGSGVWLPLSEEPPSAQRGFAKPRLYSWADVSDRPWTKLPRLDEAALRELTGIVELKLRTHGPLYRDAEGRLYEPPQHLFLDVPADAVASPRIEAPAENSGQLNNDLDFNWKSAAWLRASGRPGPENDVLLLRFDVAEPLLHLLRTRGRPATESLVGWLLVEHKLAYVVLVDLDAELPPETVLGLLTRQPERVGAVPLRTH